MRTGRDNGTGEDTSAKMPIEPHLSGVPTSKNDQDSTIVNTKLQRLNRRFYRSNPRYHRLNHSRRMTQQVNHNTIRQPMTTQQHTPRMKHVQCVPLHSS